MEKNINTDEILDYLNSRLNLFLLESSSFPGERDSIERVQYYESCTINGIDFNNLFIETQKDIDDNLSFHIYSNNYSNKIATINSDKLITSNIPGLEDYLNDIDSLSKILPSENTLGISHESSTRSIDQHSPNSTSSSKTSTNYEKQNQNRFLNANTEKQEQNENDDFQLINYSPITDPTLKERMPGLFDDAPITDYGVAYSQSLNAYVITKKDENGDPKPSSTFQPSQMATRSIISVNRDGSKIERQYPYSLMQTNPPSDKEIAISISSGYIDIQTVDVTSCNDRIARHVSKQGEGRSQETHDINRFFYNSGTHINHNFAHNFTDIEYSSKDTNNSNSSEISESSSVPNTNVTWGDLSQATGKTVTELVSMYSDKSSPEWEENFKEIPEAIKTASEYSISLVDIPRIIIEAHKDKVSLHEFIRHMDNGSTLEEKIENAHNAIAQEYGDPTKNR